MKVPLALVLFGIAGGPMVAWASSLKCLCTYGQSCWPSAATFSQLQSQVSQPLIYPRPSASACYPWGDPSGNCTAVHENWADGNWRASMPGSMEDPAFETTYYVNGTTDACYLDTEITHECRQGNVPVIGVDARSVQDVQAAVTFAVQHNLKLVVKNTGHDFLGRSAARGSFVVWTHHMKNITYDSAFVPRGAPSDKTYEAVTLAAGVQFHEAVDAVNSYGRLIVTGLSPGGSLGTSGGWLAGGGHSPLSPTYGLGVDNALQISVVLSTGEYLVTNEYQHSDLFWALRGGGGSTYGIVTDVTYRTYPSVPTHLYTYQANITNSSVLPDLVGELLLYQGNFTDDGWGGYGSITHQKLQFFFFGPNMTHETAIASTQAWHNFTASLVPFGVVFADQLSYSPSWYALYQSLFGGGGGNGVNTLLTSRLLSRDTITKNYTLVADILLDCNATFNMVAGGKVNEIDADSAGLNPAWRKAVVETVCAVTWEDDKPLGFSESITQLTRWVDAMYNVSPNDGAYFNEGSPYEVNWQETFFGSHYDILKAVKDKYDPHNIFVVTEGVGYDDWTSDLMCRY